jgi:hypothetical protein
VTRKNNSDFMNDNNYKPHSDTGVSQVARSRTFSLMPLNTVSS